MGESLSEQHPYCTTGVVWAKFAEGIGAVIMKFDAPGIEIVQSYTSMVGHPKTGMDRLRVLVFSAGLNLDRVTDGR